MTSVSALARREWRCVRCGFETDGPASFAALLRRVPSYLLATHWADLIFGLPLLPLFLVFEFIEREVKPGCPHCRGHLARKRGAP